MGGDGHWYFLVHRMKRYECSFIKKGIQNNYSYILFSLAPSSYVFFSVYVSASTPAHIRQNQGMSPKEKQMTNTRVKLLFNSKVKTKAKPWTELMTDTIAKPMIK